LRQVLINLISNAIKFTQQGNIKFGMRYKNEVGYFTIEDTGLGISKQNQEQIFKPFERVSELDSTTPGTGLGLTISRGLTELMGGDISVISEIGQGSCFKLSLFLPKIAHVTKESIAEKSINHYEGPEKTILVVDDEIAQRELVRDIMTPVGFKVVSADSAFAAMSVLNHQYIDLILLDLKMPDVNGWQAAKQIRAANFKQPIVIVSANVRDLEVSNTAEGYHNDYLVKPFAINALLEKVGRWLSLTWVYDEDDLIPDTQNANGLHIGKNQYNALKVLAEIGYLSGFTSKLNKIHQEYTFPDGVYPLLRDYAQQCQFQKIIQKLEALVDESDVKS
jgi:CheY-like chemotaxis protein